MFKVGVTIAALVATLMLTGFAHAKDTFKTKLGGDQEVPSVDTETTGKFKIQFNKQHTEAEYTLTVKDGVRVTQAHLHCAPAGVNGPIVVFLAGFHAPGWDVDGKWISNATVTDANIVNAACGTTLSELVQAMKSGNVYLNVHSVAFPGGVIRGQIEADD